MQSLSRRLYSSQEAARSLGQFLETRDSVLRSIDEQVAKRREANHKRALLDKASTIARGVNVSTTPSVVDVEPQDFMTKTRQTSKTGPNHTSTDTGSRDELTIKTMLGCGMHLGHATSRWCPRMAPFIYGIRSGIHIVDLEKSLACLRQACQVVKHLASKPEAVIVFVGCRDEKVKRLCYEVAMSSHQYYINTRWTAGTLTNASTVLGHQMALHHAIGADPSSACPRPSLLVLLEWSEVAVREAERSHCPTIALCDTNNDPTLITYPIPGNDDAFATVELVGRLLGRAAQEGRERVKRLQEHPDQRIVDAADRFAKQALDQWHPALFH